jgi:serine palmitoyltransferase
MAASAGLSPPSLPSSKSSSATPRSSAEGAGDPPDAVAGGLPPPPQQQPSPPLELQHHNSEEPTWFAALTTYLGFATLILFGHLRDFLAKLTGRSRYFKAARAPPPGYAPLLQDWENFYTRRLYHRIQDCWNRPIEGPPLSGKLPVVMRETTDGNFSLSLARRAGDADAGAGAGAAPSSASTSTSSSSASPAASSSVRTCINLSSYNYLGFADDWKETCRTDVLGALERFPVSVCASFAEGGYLSLHRELERSVADFVGKEDAVIFNMGWATNGLGIPSIVGKGCLIISDSLNHNSIVAGARSSGAEVRVFRHNDLDGLEALIKKSILDGQPHRNRQWRKILVAIEGIYSMEGESVDLQGVVRIAKRHKCYVYLDEAHSIGAMGARGRGICEHAGVDPALVDVLMGTFTKSFGAMGGYIAGSREFVAHVRRKTAGFLLDNAMSPVVCQQILTAFRIMKGEDGTGTGLGKITRLRENSDYFRRSLIAMGLDVFGCEDTGRERAQARARDRAHLRARACACVRDCTIGLPRARAGAAWAPACAPS